MRRVFPANHIATGFVTTADYIRNANYMAAMPPSTAILLTLVVVPADTAGKGMSLNSVRNTLPGSVIVQTGLLMSVIPANIRRLVLFQSAYIRHVMLTGSMSES